jgi:hypothetical protein
MGAVNSIPASCPLLPARGRRIDFGVVRTNLLGEDPQAGTLVTLGGVTRSGAFKGRNILVFVGGLGWCLSLAERGLPQNIPNPTEERPPRSLSVSSDIVAAVAEGLRDSLF